MDEVQVDAGIALYHDNQGTTLTRFGRRKRTAARSSFIRRDAARIIRSQECGNLTSD